MIKMPKIRIFDQKLIFFELSNDIMIFRAKKLASLQLNCAQVFRKVSELRNPEFSTQHQIFLWYSDGFTIFQRKKI